MKTARLFKKPDNHFIIGKTYNYEFDNYVVIVYRTNEKNIYFGIQHFFNHFIDVNDERKQKLEKLK